LSDERALKPTPPRPANNAASAAFARTAFPRNVLRAIRRVFQPNGLLRQAISRDLLFEVQDFCRERCETVEERAARKARERNYSTLSLARRSWANSKGGVKGEP
jgi:hypothetical protein